MTRPYSLRPATVRAVAKWTRFLLALGLVMGAIVAVAFAAAVWD